MNWPFVILGLPRSRTYCLSQWLARPGASVGHDLAIEADSIQAWLDLLWPLAGTCETAAALAWPLLAKAMPGGKVVTIRRPIEEVERSLANFGIQGVRDELALRDAALDAAEAAGALSIPFAELEDVNCCAWLYEHLTGAPFDFNHWQRWSRTNSQVDMPVVLARQAERASQLAGLRAEVLAGGPKWLVRIGLESFRSIWADGQQMGWQHYLESNGGERPGHPFSPNVEGICQIESAGVFCGLSARVNGVLMGYISWSLVPDMESIGVLMADQGAWFVSPEAPSELRLGRRLLDASIAFLRTRGIHELQLHAPVAGRGSRLAGLFARLGARPTQSRWALWIGDHQDA